MVWDSVLVGSTLSMVLISSQRILISSLTWHLSMDMLEILVFVIHQDGRISGVLLLLLL